MNEFQNSYFFEQPYVTLKKKKKKKTGLEREATLPSTSCVTWASLYLLPQFRVQYNGVENTTFLSGYLCGS